jgi:chemotaxis protein CheX
MNIESLVVSSIRHSAVQVFSTMLASEIEAGDLVKDGGGLDMTEGVVSFIGIAGNWTGTGSLTCSASLACRLCSRMLMTEVASLDEDVLDAIAELTNMIVGNVKSDLERYVGELGLSLPTVVFGKNFRTKTGGGGDWIVQKLFWEGEEILVKMCLTPADKCAHQSPHTVNHQPVEI